MATRLDVLQVAETEYELHPTESWGTNWGPRVSIYQKVTGAFRAPWCVSFLQYCLSRCDVGPIANKTAGVWYLWGYAGDHGWQTKIPTPGAIAILPGINRSGHCGLVEKVNGKIVYTIEGNSNNTITKHTRGLSEFVGFINYPASKPVPVKKPPLFQVVVGDKSKAKVVAIGPWGSISARLPGVVAKYHAARVVRKWRL